MIVVKVFVCGRRDAYCCHPNQHQQRKHSHYDRKEGIARVHVEGEPPGRGEPDCGDDAHQSEGSPAPVTDNIFKAQR
jgi:hypothetical protein